MPSMEEDEALARALHQEFQRDYERQSSRRPGQPATTTNTPADPPATAPSAVTANNDEGVAIRLEQEPKDKEISERMSKEDARRRRRRSNRARKSRSQQPDPSTRAAGRSSVDNSETIPEDSPTPHPAPSAPVDVDAQTESSGSRNTPARSETRSEESAANIEKNQSAHTRPASRQEPLNDGGGQRSSHRRAGSRRELSTHSRRDAAAAESRSNHTRSGSRRAPRSSGERASQRRSGTGSPNQSNHVSTSSPSPVSPTPDTPPSGPTDLLSASHHSIMSSRTAKDLELARRLEQEEKDEEMARQVMEEEKARAALSLNEASAHSQRDAIVSSRSSHQRSQREARTSMSRSSHSMRNVSSHSLVPESARSSSPAQSAVEDVEIAEIARKLDQEERDEQLARSIVQRERARSSRRMTIYAEDGQAAAGRVRCTLRRIVSLGVPIIVIIAAAVGLVIAFTGGSGSLFGVPVFSDTDPWDGVNPDEANRWKNNGNGLELTIVDALEAEWRETFEIAINDWDVGNPDALTLVTEKVPAEKACKPVTGKMKVCDGDYGDTKWRGINQVLLTNGWIIASTAKLNEYYLGTADRAQRQYTMCHEIGHGFGLPHTDENFYNEDLGNCMDYTTNPAANEKPDDTNYQFLEDLYGSVSGSVRRTSVAPQFPVSLSEEVLAAYDDAVQELEFGPVRRRGWDMLHTSQHGEGHSKDLGGGFTLEVHMLRSLDD